MKNLTGYLKKTPLLFSLVLSLLLFKITPSIAQSGFNLSSEFIHTIQETTVTTEALLTISSDTPKVISYFTITLPQENINTTCRNTTLQEDVECSSYNRGGATDILFDLNNTFVKPSSPIVISVSYTSTITPGNSYNLVSKFDGYGTDKITLTYPKIFGEPLWASDTIQNIKAIGETYQIQVERPTYQNLSVLFGEHVSYEFEISRSFTNTLDDDNQTFEIIVPSDSTHQTIIWGSIDPLPNLSEQDEDGNYIFQYVLPPNTSQDCTIKGVIVMHGDSENIDLPQVYLTNNIGYWKPTERNEFTRILNYLKSNISTVDDTFSDIQKLDNDSQELIYKYLYSYTIERLNPQTNLEEGVITDSRVGFDQLVENPNEVTPSDYTDFLITILRYYGIPARQVIGFVSNISGYTSDGFYNYWVEAYDYVNERWIVMDPFLEDFTQKSLFNNPYFDHISILRRGKNPVAPKLTFYQDTDFKVVYNSETGTTPTFDVETSLYFEDNTILSPYVKGLFSIKNEGNTAVRDYKITQTNIQDIEKYIDPVNNFNSQIILPHQSATMQFNIPNISIPEALSLSLDFSVFDYSQGINIAEGINIQTPIFVTVLVKILSMSLFVGVVYLIYFAIRKKRQHG